MDEQVDPQVKEDGEINDKIEYFRHGCTKSEGIYLQPALGRSENPFPRSEADPNLNIFASLSSSHPSTPASPRQL